MYLRIEEDLYKKIQNITNTDYEYKYGFIPAENTISLIEDLMCEIDRLNEKVEDIEQDIESNYKPISTSEQVGIIDKDFIEVL